jgi:hypothetical protein
MLLSLLLEMGSGTEVLQPQLSLSLLVLLSHLSVERLKSNQSGQLQSRHALLLG